MHGAPGATGSHRHDQGGAADFKLFDKDGKPVSINDPRYFQFVQHAARAGMAGGGSAPHYMGMYTTHLDPGHRGGVYEGSPAFRRAMQEGRKEFLAQGMPKPPSTARIDGANQAQATPPTARGAVDLTIKSDGSAAKGAEGGKELFQPSQVRNHEQMRPTQDGASPGIGHQ
jgi:hypothetical protein